MSKPIPNEGLATNRFPYQVDDGIHNYIYWTHNWDIPEIKIKPLFPKNIDLISYINPPNLRSMDHKPHRNIFIKVGAQIPQIEHIFDGTMSNNNVRQIIWTSRTFNNLWSLPLFNRWYNHRTPDLDRLIVLLYYGGFIGCEPHPIYGVFSSETNLLKSKFIGATTFDPLIFDYLQYITNQTDEYRMKNFLSGQPFYEQLSSWEKDRWTIVTS